MNKINLKKITFPLHAYDQFKISQNDDVGKILADKSYNLLIRDIKFKLDINPKYFEEDFFGYNDKLSADEISMIEKQGQIVTKKNNQKIIDLFSYKPLSTYIFTEKDCEYFDLLNEKIKIFLKKQPNKGTYNYFKPFLRSGGIKPKIKRYGHLINSVLRYSVENEKLISGDKCLNCQKNISDLPARFYFCMECIQLIEEEKEFEKFDRFKKILGEVPVSKNLCLFDDCAGTKTEGSLFCHIHSEIGIDQRSDKNIIFPLGLERKKIFDQNNEYLEYYKNIFDQFLVGKIDIGYYENAIQKKNWDESLKKYGYALLAVFALIYDDCKYSYLLFSKGMSFHGSYTNIVQNLQMLCKEPLCEYLATQIFHENMRTGRDTAKKYKQQIIEKFTELLNTNTGDTDNIISNDCVFNIIDKQDETKLTPWDTIPYHYLHPALQIISRWHKIYSGSMAEELYSEDEHALMKIASKSEVLEAQEQFISFSYGSNKLFDLCVDAENIVRQENGIPPIGEGWIRETEIYYLTKELFPKLLIESHASPFWLGRQHLDVFIPELNLAFEIHGLQHRKPIDFFGGVEAFEKNKERDERKKKLCDRKKVKVVYLHDYESDKEIKDKIIKAVKMRLGKTPKV